MVNNQSVLRLMSLAFRLAHQFAEARKVPHSERDDLCQTACTALVLAREGFKANKGSTFKEYAGKWVRGEIACWWRTRVRELVNEYKSDTLDFLETGVTQRRYVDLSWVWPHLSPREAQILRHAYGIDTPRLTGPQTGELLGVSRQMVNKIKKRAFSKLRKLTVQS